MHEPSYTSVIGVPGFRSASISQPMHIQEIEEERAAFRAWQRLEKLKQDLRWLASFWPVAVGVVLGLMAPQLGALLSRSMPWAMWILFPFALLAQRPEVPAGLHIAFSLPVLILCVQFPIEALIARSALRGRVTVPGVAGRVFYMHYLGALQLLMVSGVVSQLLGR